MVELAELQQKIEKLPRTIHWINDEYNRIKILYIYFNFQYFRATYFFSYTEKREIYLADLAYKDTYNWTVKYIFNHSELEKSQLIISNSNTIKIFFESKISLFIINQTNHYEHEPLLVNEISIPFLNTEDTLDVFNLLKKIKVSPR
jgi:hypothetical protein